LKKLRQIEVLLEQQKTGTKLNEAQQQKIKTKVSLEKELKELELK